MNAYGHFFYILVFSHVVHGMWWFWRKSESDLKASAKFHEERRYAETVREFNEGYRVQLELYREQNTQLRAQIAALTGNPVVVLTARITQPERGTE